MAAGRAAHLLRVVATLVAAMAAGVTEEMATAVGVMEEVMMAVGVMEEARMKGSVKDAEVVVQAAALWGVAVERAKVVLVMVVVDAA